MTQAVDFYREDFLAGFSLRDSSDFDDWVFFQAENLRRELVGALDRLVRHLAMQHDYDAAITQARHWIAVDPLQEAAHRELMKLYALTDQRAAALRQYQECVRVLKQELDVEPLTETTQLHEAIRANKLKAAAERPVTPNNRQSAAVSNLYPFVGRAAELETLLHAFTSSHDGRCVAIEGEAGIGKTRLVAEDSSIGCGIDRARYSPRAATMANQICRTACSSKSCARPSRDPIDFASSIGCPWSG